MMPVRMPFWMFGAKPKVATNVAVAATPSSRLASQARRNDLTSIRLNTASMTPRAQQELKAFNDRFTKKHGYTPAVHATLGYLGAMVLFRDVLPKAGGVDPDKIREVAGQLDIPDGDTVMGWGVKFAPPDHKNAGQNLRSYAVMMQWQEGKLYVVSPEKWAVRKVTLPLPTWEERRKK